MVMMLYSVLYFLIVFCRYLHERFVQLQEEVSLLKTNLMKYKVSGDQSTRTHSTSRKFGHAYSFRLITTFYTKYHNKAVSLLQKVTILNIIYVEMNKCFSCLCLFSDCTGE